MKHYPPTISADDSRFGIRWSEIYEVRFREAIEAITRKLPGIDKKWLENIESLDKDTYGVLVWRRP
jgi:hypothetical protein